MKGVSKMPFMPIEANICLTHIRILTTPVRLTGSVHPQQLASLVAIDAMLRRRNALGEKPVSWPLTTIIGDAAIQRAVQLAVAREGEHRERIGREGFEVRARQLESTAAVDLRALLTELGVNADLDTLAPDSELVSRVARVAFVRLYESGLLRRTDAVLDSCPSCETVVDSADADDVELDVDHLRVAIALQDESMLEVDTAEPELWVGAVAVAVPAELNISDAQVFLPLLGAEVPLIHVDGLTATTVVVPGHDRWSYELAKQLNLPIVEVLDSEGIVRQPGVLESLGRFAARSAATEQLTMSGNVVAHFNAPRIVQRCHRCATVLVPLFGRHWILDFSELVEPVVQAINNDEIVFSPPVAREYMLEIAERVGSWCISQQLWAGHRIPVFTCLDCGQTRVSVEEETSCGSCMGTLQPDTDVLDARFIAALSPIVAMGWPVEVEDAADVSTTLSVGRVGLDTWALPIAALGLRLADAIPFSQVVLHQLPVGASEAGQQSTAEILELLRTEGRLAVRAALLAGDLNIDRAHESLQLLRSPVVGEGILKDQMEAFDNALDALDAGEAWVLLMNAARSGLTAESAAEINEFVTPLLVDAIPISDG